jgi:drug/metabolite transporter (DMT)-like permease
MRRTEHTGLWYGLLGVAGFSLTLPKGAPLASLAIVAAGVILGFPLLSAWAMQDLPAAHGAIALGLLPPATAGAAAVRASERHSALFWGASLAGSGAVVWFAFASGAGRLHPADLALLGAVVAAAIGYAEGGRVAREMGGLQVISWALLLAAPFLVIPLGIAIRQVGLPSGPAVWLAFPYIGVVSQFAAFIAWYKGLALGGVARVAPPHSSLG